MYKVGGTQDESRMGRFFIVSIAFHALLLIFAPQWEGSPIAGTMPGEGVFQFTLRQPTEFSSFSLQRVTPRQSVPQPTARPTTLQTVQTPQQQVQVAERPKDVAPQQVAQVPVQQPQVNPAPPSQTPAFEPVEVAQQAPPTPPSRPEAPTTETQSLPVITSDSGAIPVATQGDEVEVTSDTTEDAVGGTGTEDGEGEAGAVEEAPPPPPPPPPAVGSMLTFPGGMFIPKNYERGWGTVSVRVVVTVDEHGNVERAEVDPTMRSSIQAINDWAIGYALHLVEAQPGPEGQAYQAAFVVRFDPEAGSRGITFGTDPEELVEYLIRN